MAIQVKKPQIPDYWKPLLAVFLLAVALVLGAQLIPKPSVPLFFEVANFEGDVQIYDPQTRSWHVPERGEEFGASQKIRTGADGMINLQVENEIRLRLKENSELNNKQSAIVNRQEIYKLHLEKGILFGATTKEFERKKAAQKVVFQVKLPEYNVEVAGAIFRVETPAENGLPPPRAGVLRGSIEASASSIFSRRGGIRIRGLERVNVVDGVVQPAARVSQEEWSTLKEAYELLEKSAVQESEQIDLSKHAGTMFDYVFDHGTFYTPKVGYAGREFYTDPDSGDVYLEVEYDVFPAGSFVGVYIKTRNFDIAQYDGLSFETRRHPEEGVPESFFVELKSKGNVIRRFAPRGFERTWKKEELDFHVQKSTLVNEVVLVFTNARVGEAKKGVLELRNFNLIPRKVPLELPAKTEEKSAAPDFPKPAVPQPVSAAVTASPVPQPVAVAVPSNPAAQRSILKEAVPFTAGGSEVPSSVVVAPVQAAAQQPAMKQAEPFSPVEAELESVAKLPKEIPLEQ